MTARFLSSAENARAHKGRKKQACANAYNLQYELFVAMPDKTGRRFCIF